MNTLPEKIDPNTGEVLPIDNEGTSLAIQMAQVELNQAVATAKAFPRSLHRARDNIAALVMLDEETAAECVYALPRGGKPIKGPSVRFAEIVASQFGNCHVGSRVVAVDKFEKVVIAEGVFLDLESGMKRTAQVRRRIADKQGRLFNDDMITVTGNAAASVAMREAILKGVPKALWRAAYDAAEKVIAGDVKTLSVRRSEAIKAFAAFGVTPEQIFKSLEVEGIDEIGLDQIATLTAMFKAIKSGEQTPESYFPPNSEKEKAQEAAKGTAAKLNAIAKPEDPIAAARSRGTEAKKAGAQRRAVPAEYRDPARQAEADAWFEGYDAQAAAEEGKA